MLRVYRCPESTKRGLQMTAADEAFGCRQIRVAHATHRTAISQPSPHSHVPMEGPLLTRTVLCALRAAAGAGAAVEAEAAAQVVRRNSAHGVVAISHAGSTSLARC